MVTGIIGKKLGMTQVFGQDGTATPGTVIKAGPCVVVQAKAAATDGYDGGAARAGRGASRARAQAARRPLQEGRRAADAHPPRGRAGGRQRGAEAGRSGAHHRPLRERRSRRRHRHQPRQGLPGRHEAPQLPRRRGHARFDVPPRARIDRRLVVPVARRQGDARCRTHGRRPRHDPQPQGRAGRRREQPAGAEGRHPRRAGRIPDRAQGDRAQARSQAAGREAVEGCQEGKK